MRFNYLLTKKKIINGKILFRIKNQKKFGFNYILTKKKNKYKKKNIISNKK